jgi:hypothetical protein
MPKKVGKLLQGVTPEGIRKEIGEDNTPLLCPRNKDIQQAITICSLEGLYKNVTIYFFFAFGATECYTEKNDIPFDPLDIVHMLDEEWLFPILLGIKIIVQFSISITVQ